MHVSSTAVDEVVSSILTQARLRTGRLVAVRLAVPRGSGAERVAAQVRTALAESGLVVEVGAEALPGVLRTLSLEFER